MTHNNISFFIPHLGCPHACIFCSQNKISGREQLPTLDYIKKTCSDSLKRIKNPRETEIAFFGGSFTAIDRDLMIAFLESVQEFIGNEKFYGVRISTRPDYIDEEIIEILRKYNVTAIELGAQSMNNKVLELNERGHTEEDIIKASKLIKANNIELGLQMMCGMYGSNVETDFETMKKISELEPQTVRIYPTVIIENTRLAEIYKSGKYEIRDIMSMAEECSKMLEYFESRNIRVIKCGLHAEKTLEENLVGGYYHPSFRELCEMLIYRRRIEEIIKNTEKKDIYKLEVGRGCRSKAIGQKRANIEYFKDKNINIKIVESEDSKENYYCKETE